jgi:hypothetical protein
MRAHVPLDLTTADATTLMKPIRGRGGFQNLLRKLQQQLGDPQLEVSPTDRERLSRYATAYGGGGFQQRIAERHSAHR